MSHQHSACKFWFEKERFSINDTCANVGTSDFLLHNWHTSAAAVLQPSCSVCLGCGLWTGLNSRKSCLMEDRPNAAEPLPPRPQRPHCLLHINKLAGPPRFEAALCYCRRREVPTNSHIQNDMISQLEARARQEISTVRQLWCGLLSTDVTLVGFHADFCQT